MIINKNNFIKIINELPDIDNVSIKNAKKHQLQLTKPKSSLGKLEDIATWIAGWQQTEKPEIHKPHCIIFAGNHGIAQNGVSAFPQEVTVQMVQNFKNGGAAINQLCKVGGIGFEVVELDNLLPTKDFSISPAMSEEECISAINVGFTSVTEDVDFLLLGEMGIGNSSSASAMCAAAFGGVVESWIGAGTGVNSDTLQHKINIIESSIKLHVPNMVDGFDILQHLGGKELAAIVGAIISARLKRIPIMLDGFICTSAAAILHAYNSSALNHCLVAHKSQEAGHTALLKRINKEPLLDLEMRLGEGSGAATAYPIIKAALAVHSGMATFEAAQVSGKS